MRFLCFVFCFSWLAITHSSTVQNYDVELLVEKNAVLWVTETIVVEADGRSIKRGIYRDFPTSYRNANGRKVKVGFQILSVKQDGKNAAYHTQSVSNGLRLYVGEKDKLLNPGRYTYEIRYSVRRALGFFQTHDELYWNVTGNDWAFPILAVSAEVALPQGANILNNTAFTGRAGERGQRFTAKLLSGTRMVFKTTEPLPPRQGLTIVVGFEKGVITNPTNDYAQDTSSDSGIVDFLIQNIGVVLSTLGLIGVFLFYLLAWYFMGRDPKPITVIPRFEPPKGFSPQALRYIKKMRYDEKMFSSALVHLAVKGVLSIEKKRMTICLSKKNQLAQNSRLLKKYSMKRFLRTAKRL